MTRRTRGETLEKTKEGEVREGKKEEFASKQAKFQKSSKKPEAVGCCYAATIDHLGGRRRDSWSVRVFGHEILAFRAAGSLPIRQQVRELHSPIGRNLHAVRDR